MFCRFMISNWMTYLKLMNLKKGMLLNFKVDLMKEGIHRVFNILWRLSSFIPFNSYNLLAI